MNKIKKFYTTNESQDEFTISITVFRSEIEKLKFTFTTIDYNEKILNMNIKCPKCNSEQITSQKKGFGFGKALAGIFVAGPLGAIAGTVGASKIKIHCLSCGNKWSPSKSNKNSYENTATLIPNKKQKSSNSLPREKTEEERRKEIYRNTGLSASDPKFGSFRKPKKRR